VNPDLTITTESFPGGVLVMTVEGELDILSAPEFKARLDDAIAGPSTAIFVDLADCGFLDSTTLKIFAHAAQELDGEGQRLSLVVPTAIIRRVFEITHLEGLFTMYSDRDTALRSSAAATGTTSNHDRRLDRESVQDRTRFGS
jgi:anti-sigma B factor antagonist